MEGAEEFTFDYNDDWGGTTLNFNPDITQIMIPQINNNNDPQQNLEDIFMNEMEIMTKVNLIKEKLSQNDRACFERNNFKQFEMETLPNSTTKIPFISLIPENAKNKRKWYTICLTCAQKPVLKGRTKFFFLRNSIFEHKCYKIYKTSLGNQNSLSDSTYSSEDQSNSPNTSTDNSLQDVLDLPDEMLISEQEHQEPLLELVQNKEDILDTLDIVTDHGHRINKLEEQMSKLDIEQESKRKIPKHMPISTEEQSTCDNIIEILKKNPGLSGREIGKRLKLDRTTANHLIYKWLLPAKKIEKISNDEKVPHYKVSNDVGT